MQKVIMTGNIVRDIETNDARSFGKTAIAVRRDYKDKNTGEYQSDFFNVTMFPQTLDLMERFGIKKGSKVLLEGKFQTGSYEKDGVKVNTFEFIAERFENFSPREESENNNFSNASVTDSDLPF